MTTPTDEQPARYRRSAGGLVGAMVLLVVLVGGFAVVQAVLSGHDETPVAGIDYAPVVSQARSQHRLLVLAPDPLPAGWRATSMNYQDGAQPRWHLGMLTQDQKYIAIEESTESERGLAGRVLKGTPVRGSTVGVGGESWRVWSGGGDYALVRRTPNETVLVGGSAGRSAVTELAGQLSSGTVKAP